MGRGWRLGLALIVCVCLGLIAPPLGGRVSAQSQPSPYQLIVYTSYGAPGSTPLVGHVFVDLKDASTGSHVIMGKYPSTNNYFYTPGLIKSDANIAWSWRISFNLTRSQLGNASAFVESERRQTSAPYRLTSTNCMNWAATVARAAGQTLPANTDWAGVPSPLVFRDALVKAGSGGTINGGTVLGNKNPGSTASGAPDPLSSPPCCDAPGILETAMSDPTSLSQDMQLQLTDRGLAPDSLNRDDSYSVEITNAHPNQSLYGVRWGDGTTTFGHLPIREGNSAVQFEHTYRAPPTQPLRVLVLENGQVSEFDRTLQFARGSGHKEVDVQPPPGPEHAYS